MSVWIPSSALWKRAAVVSTRRVLASPSKTHLHATTTIATPGRTSATLVASRLDGPENNHFPSNDSTTFSKSSSSSRTGLWTALGLLAGAAGAATTGIREQENHASAYKTDCCGIAGVVSHPDENFDAR